MGVPPAWTQKLVNPATIEQIPPFKIFFFTFVNLIKLPLYINLSMANFDSFKQSVILFQVALLGILIGYRLVKIIEEKLFYNILYILIFISSSKLLYDFLI